MKKLSYVLVLCIAAFLLTGCFPSKRMYVVDNCAAGPHPASNLLCGFMPNGSEFAFVKQNSGSKYEIWVNQDPSVQHGPMLVLPDCEGRVRGNTFKCDLCGAPDSFRISKASGSDCQFDKCVKIKADRNTPRCPGGGQSTGGGNND